MKWQKQPPKVNGFYWWHDKVDGGDGVVWWDSKARTAKLPHGPAFTARDVTGKNGLFWPVKLTPPY